MQDFINSFKYNFCPGYHFNVNKHRSFSRIVATAREMIRESLPIKCIEAVFICLYLTCGWVGVDRIPLSFKTSCRGQVYRCLEFFALRNYEPSSSSSHELCVWRHIVLVIYHRSTNRFGVVGISRRQNLMYKDLTFHSISEVVSNFRESYEVWGHILHRLHLGLSVSHDPYSRKAVCWRCCTIDTDKKTWDKVCSTVDEYGGQIYKLDENYRVSGIFPEFDKCWDLFRRNLIYLGWFC